MSADVAIAHQASEQSFHIHRITPQFLKDLYYWKVFLYPLLDLYKNLDLIKKEAKKIFKNTKTAKDLMKIKI